jgi:hypothetical protein
MVELSPFEVIYETLNDGKPKTAKEVAQFARTKGIDWSRENANSSLYKMMRNSLVVKIETEKAPLWTLPEFAQKLVEEHNQPKKNIISFKSKKVPLSADTDLTITIQGIEMQFQFNPELSPNDPYFAPDWLNQKVFVTLNPNHPFWLTFISDDASKSLQLTNIASEVYVQWHVSKMTTEISAKKLLEIRDKALRDIALT